MGPDVTGIAGIPRRLFVARKLLSAAQGTPVSQRQIAEAVGVTEGQVGHWEKGRQMPDLPMIDRLADALQVRPEWLAYGVEPREHPAVVGGAPAVIRVAGLEIPLATLERVPDEELERLEAELSRIEAQRAAPEPTKRVANGHHKRKRQR